MSFLKKIYWSKLYNYYKSHQLLKKVSIILGIDILVKASAFVLLPVYLRLMSQEDFGLYNYLLSIIATFSAILNLGLYVSQSKLYHENNSNYVRGSVIFTINLSLIIFLIVFISLMFLLRLDFTIINFLLKNKFNYSNYRFIVLISLVVTILSFMLTNYFYTSDNIRSIKNYNLSRIIIINLVALASLYYFPTDTVKTRLASVYISELLIFLFFSRHLIVELVANFKKEILVKSLKIGLPITISAVLALFTNFSDKFFLEKYGDLKELSKYYLALSFAGILPIVLASLQNVWLPFFLKEKNIQRNFERTKKLISKLFPLLCAFSIFIWFVFFILLTLKVVPSTYNEVLLILPILLISQIFGVLTNLYGNYLVYFEKTYVASITGFIVGILSVTSGMLLVPKIGVYGSALSSFITNFAYLIFYYLWLVNYQKKMMHQDYKIDKYKSELI